MLFLACQQAFFIQEAPSNESNDLSSVKSKIPIARGTSVNELEKPFRDLSGNNLWRELGKMKLHIKELILKAWKKKEG